MSKKNKKRILQIAIGTPFYIIAILLEHFLGDLFGKYVILVFLFPYLIIGWDVLLKAIRNLRRGMLLDENFLMVIATLGAFAVGENAEAAAVMLFYQVGEVFQSYAVSKSRRSIRELMDLRADYANVIRNGEEIMVSPEEVETGEIIVIRPGEKVPIDGIIMEGNSSLDTVALTGEAVPREVGTADEILSGSINITGVLKMQTSKKFGESTVAKILELVENSEQKKAVSEKFITKFSRYYTPVVVICALILAFLPPLITGGNWSVWIYRALTFLVVSCPCALVISIPMSFFAGIGSASVHGILIKGSSYLELLSEVDTIVLDKTGTITQGKFQVTKVDLAEDTFVEGEGSKHKVTSELLLSLAAKMEEDSRHPIGISILEAAPKDKAYQWVDSICEIKMLPGFGVSGKLNSKTLLLGNKKLLEENDVYTENFEENGTLVYLAMEQKILGVITIEDTIKPDSKAAIQNFIDLGIKRIVMLTGDREQPAKQIGNAIGIEQIYSELLPQDKVNVLEKLLSESSGKVLFCGDGINDAPVLARADVGTAMGGLGSDAAIEAADMVIMSDELTRIGTAIRISQKTLRIVRENIVFAIGIKVLVLLLASVGLANMWAAVFADVGVAVLAILNAMRAMTLNMK